MISTWQLINIPFRVSDVLQDESFSGLPLKKKAETRYSDSGSSCATGRRSGLLRTRLRLCERLSSANVLPVRCSHLGDSSPLQLHCLSYYWSHSMINMFGKVINHAQLLRDMFSVIICMFSILMLRRIKSSQSALFSQLYIRSAG